VSHPTNCPVCQSIDVSATHAENARQIGVDEATIRRHRRYLQDTDDFFGIPNEIITSRGKTVRLPDGSYEKITYSPAKKALLEVATYDDVEQALDGYTFSAPLDSRGLKPLAYNVLVADLQTGKARELKGGTKELIERVMNSFSLAVDRIKELRPQQVNLWDLGDIIEGFSNVKNQPQTNDMNLTEQIRTARRLLTEGIKMIAPLVPSLNVITVPSNHCQVRAEGSKDLASVPNDDFGIDINYTLEEKFSEHPSFAHVKFYRPNGNEEALTITTVDGSKIGAVHGHQRGKPEMMDDWWTKQSHGRRSGLHEADMLLYGHFHSMRMEQSGDQRWLIGGPSSDNGSTWFANLTGKVATGGMLSFISNQGKWEELEIL